MSSSPTKHSPSTIFFNTPSLLHRVCLRLNYFQLKKCLRINKSFKHAIEEGEEFDSVLFRVAKEGRVSLSMATTGGGGKKKSHHHDSPGSDDGSKDGSEGGGGCGSECSSDIGSHNSEDEEDEAKKDVQPFIENIAIYAQTKGITIVYEGSLDTDGKKSVTFDWTKMDDWEIFSEEEEEDNGKDGKSIKHKYFNKRKLPPTSRLSLHPSLDSNFQELLTYPATNSLHIIAPETAEEREMIDNDTSNPKGVTVGDALKLILRHVKDGTEVWNRENREGGVLEKWSVEEDDFALEDYGEDGYCLVVSKSELSLRQRHKIY